MKLAYRKRNIHDYDFFHAFCNLSSCTVRTLLVPLERLPPQVMYFFFISLRRILHSPIELISQISKH